MTTIDARTTIPAKRAKPTKGSNVAKPKSSGTTATAKSIPVSAWAEEPALALQLRNKARVDLRVGGGAGRCW